MSSDQIERDAKQTRMVLDRYRVTAGEHFDLDGFASDDLPDDMPGKHDAKALLEQGTERLAALQELLYANGTWSVLVVLQAMDAGGKDSTIKHVMRRGEPARRERHRVQGAGSARAGARFSLAGRPRRAGSRHDRHLQPLALRGRAGRPRARRQARGHRPAARADRHGPFLGRPHRRHRRLRVLSGATRHEGRQGVPQRRARRAEGALPRPPRYAGKDLEVSPPPTCPSAPAGRTTVPPTRLRSPARRARPRPGLSCRPTANGSPASSSPRRSSRRWRG